jgi:hypothetical protein
MYQPVASRTDAAKETLRRGFWDVVHHVAGRPFWGAARQTINFTRAEALLARLLRRQKGAQIAPMNQERSFFHDKGKAGRDPSAYGVLMHAQKLRSFRDFVALMDFDTAEVVPPRHASPAVLNKRANVFYAPSCYARAKLHGLGEATFFDARPPR